MQQERIIDGIENVFTRYSQDNELLVALRATSLSLQLMNSRAQSFYLCGDGRVINRHEGIFMVCDEERFSSTLRKAAEACVEDYLPKDCPEPEKVLSIFERDLDQRVAEFKRDYQQNPQIAARKHWDCGRSYF